MHWAAIGGHVPILKLLMDLNYKFGIPTRDQKTPLHLAADSGNLEAVKWLVEAGVSIFPKDRTGKTAEDYASQEGHRDIANYLHQQVINKQEKVNTWPKALI